VAIVEELEISFEMPIEIYAQDPTFTRIDEAFLASLGIQVLRTPSPSDLGEAAHYIDGSTLVYSPFLTIEAYRNVLESCNIGILVGDDFNALRSKWPKFTPEYDNVERLVKRDLIKYQRRLLSQHSKDENVFWEKEDKVFPMALYSRIQELELVGRRDKHPFSAQRGVSHIEKRISAKL
jgi:hypothetical protein